LISRFLARSAHSFAFSLAILLFALLSFHCSAPHRALHSFPTRRSSDLGCGRSSLSARRPAARPARRRGSRTTSAFPPACRPGRRDRKSTRLNSSHVEISYAVFCLKKKKTERRRADHSRRQHKSHG